MTNEEIPYVHICKEWDVKIELIMGKLDKDYIKRQETRVSTLQVQPTKWQTTRGRRPTVEKCTVDETKDEIFCKGTTPVGMIALEFYVGNSWSLVRTPKIESCEQKVEPLLLRERVLHAPIAKRAGERRTHDMTRKNLLWAHMANDVYQTVRNCAKRARNGKRATWNL